MMGETYIPSIPSLANTLAYSLFISLEMDFFHTESMLNEHENVGIGRVIRQVVGFASKGGVTSIGMYRIFVPCRSIESYKNVSKTLYTECKCSLHCN